MNSKINRVIDDIAKTKSKIAELQALLPELERKRIDMENNEIIRLVRSANIKPAEFPAFIKEVKAERKAGGAVVETASASDGSSSSHEADVGLGHTNSTVEDVEQIDADSCEDDISNDIEEA